MFTSKGSEKQKKSTTFAVVNEVGAYGRPRLQGVADSPKEAATKLNKKITIMKTLVNTIANTNTNFNNTNKMEKINVAAASQLVAGNRAEEQEEKTNLRVIKIKPAGNAKMFRTLAKAIAAGATTLIVTTRVDVAGCGYVWFGIRKGYTELDGKLLLNAQIWNYLLAFLMGKELPEVTEFEPDREICCQSEWLVEVAAEVEKLTSVTSEEYNESEEGIGYLAKKYHFPNGKVVMPAEAMEDITDLLN